MHMSTSAPFFHFVHILKVASYIGDHYFATFHRTPPVAQTLLSCFMSTGWYPLPGSLIRYGEHPLYFLFFDMAPVGVDFQVFFKLLEVLLANGTFPCLVVRSRLHFNILPLATFLLFIFLLGWLSWLC